MNMSASNVTISIADESPYHYIPTRSVTIIFAALYTVTTAIHLGQALYFRMWWLLPTAVLAGLGEIAGWSGRIWSSINVTNGNAFTMQITSTILAPTPFAAAVFIIFGHMTEHLGTQYSRLAPASYKKIFLTADILSLVVQAAGGGLASSASTTRLVDIGSDIMLAGIITQLIALILFMTCAAEFGYRFMHDMPVRCANTDGRLRDSSATLADRPRLDTRIKLLAGGIIFITTCLFIRAIYRTAELADGWNGQIISTQVLFNVLDGAMVVLAMYTLNFLHPGFLLARLVPAKDEVGALETPADSLQQVDMYQLSNVAVGSHSESLA